MASFARPRSTFYVGIQIVRERQVRVKPQGALRRPLVLLHVLLYVLGIAVNADQAVHPPQLSPREGKPRVLHHTLLVEIPRHHQLVSPRSALVPAKIKLVGACRCRNVVFEQLFFAARQWNR